MPDDEAQRLRAARAAHRAGDLQEMNRLVSESIEALRAASTDADRAAVAHYLASFYRDAGGLAFEVTRLEWLALILAIVSVWTAESLNTALEFLCDVASPEFHPLVEKAKDVAAGAVLICALGAIAAGSLVFAPYVSAALG